MWKAQRRHVCCGMFFNRAFLVDAIFDSKSYGQPSDYIRERVMSSFPSKVSEEIRNFIATKVNIE